MNTPVEYWAAHYAVKTSRGPAKDHLCVSCGGEAREWAYQYTDPACTARKQFSPDPSHYAPMCVPGHNKFDLEKDPTLLDRYRANGRRSGEILARKVREGGEYAEEVLSILEKGRKKMLAERLADPEWSLERSSAGGKIGGKVATAQRRRCSECEMVAAPPHLGTHQKASGHRGHANV